MRRYHRREMLETLLKVSRLIGSSLDIEEVGGLIVRESRGALASDHASLFLIDDKNRHLTLANAAGFSGDEIDNIKLLGSWETINEQVVRKGRAIIVNDLRKDRTFGKKNLPFIAERLPIGSFVAVPLKKDGEVVGVLIVSNARRRGHRFTGEDRRFLLTLSNNMAAALLNAKLHARLKSLFISTVKSLVRAIDAKDPYTSGHSERVMKYSLAIAREMNLSGERMENIGLSSLLHDVGKIGIREDVLVKPGRLSPSERRQINLHPEIGVGIVKTIDDSKHIIPGILEHHERFGGTGYPAHLKGRRISLEGRIIAIADSFDALTTDRPYRDRYTEEKAISILKSEKGDFDPVVRKAFISSIRKYPDFWNTNC